MFEITEEIARAQRALEIAYNHFQEATERKLVDAAVYEVSTARFRYDAAVQRAKKAEAEAVSRSGVLKAS